jgi:dienelactone hydrolase
MPINVRPSLSMAVACAALVLGAATPARAADPSLPALRTFFRHSDIDEVRLSPSGKYLALTVGGKAERVALAVVDVDEKSPPVIVAQFKDSDIRSFRWVSDDRLVFNVIDLTVGGSEQDFGPGLLSVRRDGSEMRLLIKPILAVSELSHSRREALEYNHGLISVPQDGSEDIIVGEYVFNAAHEVVAVNVLRLNVANGRKHSLALGHPSHGFDWVFDPKGEPRVLVTLNEGEEKIYWRAPGRDDWSLIGSGSFLRPPFRPNFVDAGGRLYVTTNSGPGGYASLRRFDFEKGGPEAEALVNSPGFDFTGSLVTNGAGERPIGVRLQTDAETTVWFDPRLQTLQKAVDKKLPGHVNNIVPCQLCDSPSVLLVHSWSDQDPGSYWIYRPASEAWQFVGAVRTDVDPARMATLDFHRFKARDGMEIPVWVTTPRADAPGAGKGPRAAVVLVHGGPWVRGGTWHWNGEAQFLASRGYVVIEPEFRGSEGYGFDHFKAGWKQWEGPMQDDVADAVRWAAGTGLVDEKRVCIAGASYGGYATLMGLVRYPDLYRCGIAWVAVTDPRLMFEPIWNSDMTGEWKRYGMPTLVGDPVKDAAMLRAAAPLERAGEIRAPLLMAFGRDDSRVPLVHGTRMRDALRAAGRDPEYVVYDYEGHGWLKPENTLDFYGRMERFLAKNLGPRE